TVVVGAAVGEQGARDRIVAQVEEFVAPEVAQQIAQIIDSARRPAASVLAAIVGGVTVVIGAAGLFGQIQGALNTIWDAPKEQGFSIRRLLLKRLPTFLMVALGGALLVALLILSALLAGFGATLQAVAPELAVMASLANLLIPFLAAALMAAAIFRILPDVAIPWRDVWVGAVVTAALFSIGRLIVGWYLGQASPASVYGAAGSLVVLLVWVYYSFQIFLVGAVFTYAYAERRRTRATPTTDPPAALAPHAADAVTVAPAARGRSRALGGVALIVGLVIAGIISLLAERRSTGAGDRSPS
ncbi:MAG: YihY/virulence factor BrkB family protein, partial [Dehalococcoidia bacterium]|nr:YihY/virulence factor BrkB family protein [Dehalococcoidia bacterium]